MDSNLIGSIIDGRYKIIAVLGQGGMGSVYQAEELGLDRLLALKLMHIYHLNDSESRSRFQREGKVLSALRHNNIVHIYRLGLWDEQVPYIAMEYLSGRNLRDLLNDEEVLSLPRVLGIAVQICDAMHYAHQFGIVHRDLKPNNILLVDKPQPDTVKIVDFGLVKLLSEPESLNQKLTQTGELIGTIQYISPEQCQGQKADERSDIYAVACLLYEALTGQQPFVAENPIGLMHKHVNEMPLPPSSVSKKRIFSPELEFVLLKGLQKDPACRYQSMEELRRDLELLKEKREKSIVCDYAPLRYWQGAEPQRMRERFISITLLFAFLLFVVWFFKAPILEREIGKQSTVEKPSLSVERALTRADLLLSEAAAQSAAGDKTNAGLTATRAFSMLFLIPSNVKMTPLEIEKEKNVLQKLLKLVQGGSLQSFDSGRSRFSILYERYKNERYKKDSLINHRLLDQICLEAAKNRQSWSDVANLCNHLATSYYDNHEYAEAKKYNDFCESFCQKYQIVDGLILCDALIIKTNLAILKSDKKTALTCLHKAAVIAKTNPVSSYGMSMCQLIHIADICDSLENYDLAEECLLLAKAMNKKHDLAHMKQNANSDYILGKIYMHKKRFAEAEKQIRLAMAENDYSGAEKQSFKKTCEKTLEDIKTLKLRSETNPRAL
ncbi:MAG: serine/threonine protein kinase [Candidatus Obscuribacterales bacterium]|nr:serine/threonine protein kinase [Candidatus Obscuribacterales bacterium]